MTDARVLPEKLKIKGSFSRNEFVSAMMNEYGMTDPQIAYDLQKRLDTRGIVRVGWNKYTVTDKKDLYSHEYSEVAEEVAETISDSYVDLNFQVFELVQLNDFMNHQMAHNTIFVSVENDMQDFVFDTLRSKYKGRVMLRPSVNEYYRYLQDDEIVVGRLPSESPKGFSVSWKSRLEKIVVDVFTDKLIGRIVPEGEKKEILFGAFESYLLDGKTMIRYAKRKGADTKFKKVLKEYGVVEYDR